MFYNFFHTFWTRKPDSQTPTFQRLTNPVKKFFPIFATVKRCVIAVLFFALLLPSGAAGQPRPKGFPMYYEVHDGDTTFFDSIDPVWIFPRGRRMRSGDWRKNYRLVYNFNKVYPYALVGRKMMHQVDSVLAADVTRRSQRNQYTHDVEVELFRLFEKDLRNMTVTQEIGRAHV